MCDMRNRCHGLHGCTAAAGPCRIVETWDLGDMLLPTHCQQVTLDSLPLLSGTSSGIRGLVIKDKKLR